MCVINSVVLASLLLRSSFALASLLLRPTDRARKGGGRMNERLINGDRMEWPEWVVGTVAPRGAGQWQRGKEKRQRKLPSAVLSVGVIGFEPMTLCL